MPAVDSAFEWISRNSVVFAVFKNCQKLSASFLLEILGGKTYHAHIQGQDIHLVLQNLSQSLEDKNSERLTELLQ